MAITAPGNFSCGGITEAYAGQTITCTWTAASGDFDWYRILAAAGDGFHNYYPSKTAVSYPITIGDSWGGDYGIGTDMVFSLYAGKGGHNNPTEAVQCDQNFTLYLAEAPSHPSAPSSISVGDVTQGKDVTISWASSSAGTPLYTLQRSVNGGAFQTVYTGSALSYADTAGADWNTVQYRVQVNGSYGNSDWTVSEVKTVNPGSSIALPPGGRLEQLENRNAQPVFPLTVTEGVFRQSDGKSLERVLAEMELGVTGPAGPVGQAGPGVPAGGAAGQVLVKKSGADYDTQWADAPQSGSVGQVTPADIGAVPTSRKVNGQTLDQDITLITCGTADLTAGTSPLAAGTLYGVYEG